MTISIGNLSSQAEANISEANIDRAASNQQHEALPANDAVVADGTTLTLSQATSITSLTKLAMSGDDARAAKVDHLRQDIARGTYKLEPAKIADALLAEWQ